MRSSVEIDSSASADMLLFLYRRGCVRLFFYCAAGGANFSFFSISVLALF